MAVLDTTALIDLTRRPTSAHLQRLDALLRQLIADGQTLYTSRINEAELWVGAFRAADPVRETAKINGVLSMLVMLEFDAAAAMRFGREQAHLLAAGRPAGGEADLMIAAVALVHGQSLVTRNARHFATVPGLAVLTY